MSATHLIFIPGVLLVGMVLGYVMGKNAARQALAKVRQKLQQ